jgi:hypothetical protein
LTNVDVKFEDYLNEVKATAAEGVEVLEAFLDGADKGPLFVTDANGVKGLNLDALALLHDSFVESSQIAAGDAGDLSSVILNTSWILNTLLVKGNE